MLCSEATPGNLYLQNGNPNYVWYQSVSSTTELVPTYQFMSGTYYVAHKMGNCISSRVPVQVTVNPRPNGPIGSQRQTFGFAAKVSDLQMVEPNVVWFNSFDEAMSQTNPLLPGTSLQDKKMYYGSIIGSNTCSSIPTSVEVLIDLSSRDLDLAYLKYFPNPLESELNIIYVEPIKTVEVFTLVSKKVLSKSFDATEVKVDLSSISSGTYVVRIVTDNASQFVKVVKR